MLAKTKEYWEDLACICETAEVIAPKWSPLKYVFKWYASVARKNALSAPTDAEICVKEHGDER